MPALLDLLREEKTAKLIQGIFQMAGTFVMEQVSGGDTDERERELLDKYYKSAKAVAEKGKNGKSMVTAEEPDEATPEIEERGVSVTDSKTEACAACTRNHIAAAAGLLTEGTRFLSKGLGSAEVAERIDLATQELVTAERGDLNPAKIARLPDGERKLATWMAQKVREMRHIMDQLKSEEDYRKAIIELSDLSREITKRYYTMMEDIAPEKEVESINKLCNGKPESERKKCMETMTQVLKQ